MHIDPLKAFSVFYIALTLCLKFYLSYFGQIFIMEIFEHQQRRNHLLWTKHGLSVFTVADPVYTS